MHFDMISYGAGVLSGLGLAAAPLTRSRRGAPRWTRIALWIGGSATFVWGVLGYTLLSKPPSSSPDIYTLLRLYKTVSAGIAIGILSLLLSSGESRMSFKRNTKGQ
jgi:hypothetical protein